MTGEAIKAPRKKTARFRVVKIARDAVLSPKKK
jgi:hypothetical protein